MGCMRHSVGTLGQLHTCLSLVVSLTLEPSCKVAMPLQRGGCTTIRYLLDVDIMVAMCCHEVARYGKVMAKQKVLQKLVLHN